MLKMVDTAPKATYRRCAKVSCLITAANKCLCTIMLAYTLRAQ